ncbi:unnamed protein product [Knipowitschia caucasica]|uniref:Uncharacterized protein n=1 Tax=Knipowitschia caucasica TaxID=637954 RepID=A0AAV2LD09_KNICA
MVFPDNQVPLESQELQGNQERPDFQGTEASLDLQEYQGWGSKAQMASGAHMGPWEPRGSLVTKAYQVLLVYQDTASQVSQGPRDIRDMTAFQEFKGPKETKARLVLQA